MPDIQEDQDVILKQIRKAKIKLRSGKLESWTRSNPILLKGELGFINDDPNFAGQFKVGDGHSHFNDLRFAFTFTKTLYAVENPLLQPEDGLVRWVIDLPELFHGNNSVATVQQIDKITGVFLADITCKVTRTPTQVIVEFNSTAQSIEPNTIRVAIIRGVE